MTEFYVQKIEHTVPCYWYKTLKNNESGPGVRITIVRKYNKACPKHTCKEVKLKLGYARSFYNSLFKDVLTQ